MKCVGRFPAGRERHLDSKFVVVPHRIGNSYLLYGQKDSQFPFHCFVGPEWPCMVCTYSLIIIPSIFFFVNVCTQWSSGAVLAIGILTFLFVVVAFSFTACSDPGIIFVPSLYIPGALQEDKSELGEAGTSSSSSGGGGMGAGTGAGSRSGAGVGLQRTVQTFPCSICNIERPRTASHCYECGVCVDQLDHHCESCLLLPAPACSALPHSHPDLHSHSHSHFHSHSHSHSHPPLPPLPGPWTGKCIARKNLRFFYMFLTALLLHVAYVVAIFAASLAQSYKVFPSPAAG